MIDYTSRVRSLVLACLLLCLGARETAGQKTSALSESGFGPTVAVPADVLAMRRVLRSYDEELPRPAAASYDEGLRRPAASSYDVVALRVEFQPDTSRFTTGDGTFGGTIYGDLDPAIDPLPHEAAYFEAHLDFLEHYVERVSDGRTVVRTHLIPETVQVSKRMGAYAPTGPNADTDAELAKLAALVHEAWSSAEADFEMSRFDPDRTAFVLFHAGVGRDVETIGTTLEKTPQDLPSLFFDRGALRRLDIPPITFNGFPVEHSMILPRTETRIGTDFIADEPFLLELSINGLLAASFFNFLGVPDLFDTSTGESAIGPFGLMDTQGIFAYRGLFPPEPMAWTKYFLGWTDPLSLEGEGPATAELDAASLPDVSPSARAVVSESEYFLVENRYRDPEGDGLTLFVRQDGALVEQHVANGDPEFNGFVVEGFIGGVVVGVDNYDWALPGGLDENGNPLNGGILIWHVDERRLRAGLPANAVNVGPNARAVDLEEADGAQDIGFSSGPFGPQAELGTPFDFYFEGNPVRVQTQTGREVRFYQNRFGIDTFPSSETNGGGPSFVVLEGFSEPGTRMAFTYRRASVSGITQVDVSAGEDLEQLVRSQEISFDAGSSVSLAGDRPVLYSASSRLAVLGGPDPTTVEALTEPVATAGGRLITLGEGPAITSYVVDAGELEEVWSSDLPGETEGMEAVSPLVRNVFERFELFHVLMADDDETLLVRASADGASVQSLAGVGSPVGIASVEGDLGGEILVVGREGAGYPGREPLWTYEIPDDDHIGQPAFGRDKGGLIGAIPLHSSGAVRLLGPDGNTRTLEVASEARRHGAAAGDLLGAFPVLVDADDDGHLDVLVTFGSILIAFSQEGAVVEGFPIGIPAPVVAQPLVARMGDEWTVLAASADGYLYSYDRSGRLHPGFPLEIGNAALATPLISGDRLVTVAESGTVKSWQLARVDDIWWGSLHGGENNGSFVAPAVGGDEPPSARPLIDVGETYNWPNPIEEGTTHLRVRTERDAQVDVTILDAAGGLVDELTLGTIRAGMPAEVIWAADVQSGLYFVRFTAVSADGERATSVVKMAVIR